MRCVMVSKYVSRLFLLLSIAVLVASCAPSEDALAGQAFKSKNLVAGIDCKKPSFSGFIFANAQLQDIVCAKGKAWTCGTDASPFGSVLNVDNKFDAVCYQNGAYSTWAECNANDIQERKGKNGLTFSAGQKVNVVGKGYAGKEYICDYYNVLGSDGEVVAVYESWYGCGSKGGPDGVSIADGKSHGKYFCHTGKDGFGKDIGKFLTEDCNNNVDDDGNGKVDCKDPQCHGYWDSVASAKFASNGICHGNALHLCVGGGKKTLSDDPKIVNNFLCVDGGYSGTKDNYWLECFSGGTKTFGPGQNVKDNYAIVNYHPYDPKINSPATSYLCVVGGWYYCSLLWGPDGMPDGVSNLVASKGIVCKEGKWIQKK